MKIYVASSWRNNYQPAVIELLISLGHDVYDFRNPPNGTGGFDWANVDTQWQAWTKEAYKKALKHPVSEIGFKSDFDGMKWADICIMVLPCGRSAHTEAGWMKGMGKRVYVFHPEEHEPELMYKIYDDIIVGWKELRELAMVGWLKKDEVTNLGQAQGSAGSKDKIATPPAAPKRIRGSLRLRKDGVTVFENDPNGNYTKLDDGEEGGYVWYEPKIFGDTVVEEAKNVKFVRPPENGMYDGHKIMNVIVDEIGAFGSTQADEPNGIELNEHTVPKKIIIFKKDILSAVAYWGVSQAFGIYPFNLEHVLTDVNTAIDPFFKENVQGMITISIYQLDEILEVVKHVPTLRKWNLTYEEYRKGMHPDDNGRAPFEFISRYDKPKKDDFIDLGALIRNIRNTIVNNQIK